MSSDLKQVISELVEGENIDPEAFVLPRHGSWGSGAAAEILRTYLTKIGIDAPAVFHTLRACFATHMLAKGVDQATVMKIGGWKDIKTFQIYIRLAGVEVSGATDVLDVLPQMNSLALTTNVVSILKNSKKASAL
jgi:site-specific recombinase XerD